MDALTKQTLAEDKFWKQAVAQYRFVMEALIILALVTDSELIDALAKQTLAQHTF